MVPKIFKFHVSEGNGISKVVEVKEKDLTNDQIDLILGKLIKDFDDMPSIVRNRFAGIIINRLQDGNV